MSGLSSLVGKIQSHVDKTRAGGDVTSQVTALYEEVMEGIHTRQVDVPDFFRNIPGVWAAQQVEAQLLEIAGMILEQLQADGRKVMLAEVRLNIITAVRDAKILALEHDGRVNPLDRIAIQSQAGALKQKVRTKLMGARMSAPEEMKRDLGACLDVSEEKMLEDVTRMHGRNYDAWMRAAQATIWAVAELREQQLVGR